MRTLSIPPIRTTGSLSALVLVLVFAALAALAFQSLTAQVSGERGIAPVASSTDINVGGIEVDTTGDTPEEARQNGWLEAQRLAWKKIGGPDLPDSRLESLVSAIVVEKESLGPRRYVATLGVIFDRSRAGSLLGAGGERSRSAPMLTLPVMITGGTQTMFEVRNPWQRAWAEYQFGSSSVDYVRPSGMGGESLLLTYGQTGRRSRAWWNSILDQFGAADILVPIAHLTWQWPGGPVEGRFTARHGPDDTYLDSFTLRADSAEQLPAMLRQAVRRFDQIFSRALAQGTLAPDPSLTLDNVEVSDEVRALLAEAERAEAEERAARAREEADRARQQQEADEPEISLPEPEATPTPAAPVTSIVVQVATPSQGALDNAQSLLRGTPGVRGLSASSTDVGGNSVFSVRFAGDQSALAAALRSRGWAVSEGPGGLGISR
ncbi:heavy-metal-associated domain-containing protein [Aurantiacibacter spongiae]|uniref:Heavy-metal-associated domain-containing protein n=1 Tax=Aurantiacibacter spongiae TaxID=2488860 RepID=A0A3N5DGU1_9SPHN|nr:heavy-metal-associated domain-containing protein [Aurantiacibacter spongiae]RPF70892.1 heavy-metal-associated domain-containing protein [Aurantiacibacter spongiae]